MSGKDRRKYHGTHRIYQAATQLGARFSRRLARGRPARTAPATRTPSLSLRLPPRVRPRDGPVGVAGSSV
jgi:hypothetical protein